ncbi:MAG: CpsB/CapC family capsule biosynthesis tyrosine phosphatase [Gemmatimonadota bacterium]
MNDHDLTSVVDLHNHLVPGVDDGARDVAAVLESVERMTRVGIRRIITTPHIRAGLTLVPRDLELRLDEVEHAWETAADAIGLEFPEVEYRQGHEVMLDVPDPDFSDPRLRLAGTDFVLVEWPRMHIPPATTRVIEGIVAAGYRPVVAHPERYVGVGDSFDIVGSWRDAGAALQVNYGSFLGRYGSDPRMNAFRLLRRGWADYLSTDFHGRSNMKLYKQEAWDLLGELGARDVLATLCVTNPSRLLRNEPPLPVAPLPDERGFWARLKDLVQSEMK